MNLNFYENNNHSFDEIKDFVANINNLLSFHKNEEIDQNKKIIADIIMYSLTWIRAVEANKAIHLNGTGVILYKGHDPYYNFEPDSPYACLNDSEKYNSECVKNMDIGASAWMDGLKQTTFYPRVDERIISFGKDEIEKLYDFINDREFYNKKIEESNKELEKLRSELDRIKGFFSFFKIISKKINIRNEKINNDALREAYDDFGFSLIEKVHNNEL